MTALSARLKSCPSRWSPRAYRALQARSSRYFPSTHRPSTLCSSQFRKASPRSARAKPSRTRSVFSASIATAAGVQVSFPPASNTKRERSAGIFSLTSPVRPEQIILGRDQLLVLQSVLENLAIARFPRTGGPADAQRPRVRHSKCKSLQLFRIVRHGASSSPARDGKGKAPCIAKMEWGRAREFPARLFSAGSQALPLAFDAVLWRANEHFDQVVVQTIVKL